MATRRRKRVRRSADEARELILDAAERQLIAQGPDSLRLVKLAKEVGLSHPAILHHFGSRDGLVRAVVERTAKKLEQTVMSSLRGSLGEGDAVELFERLFRVLAEEGHARLLVWLFLSSQPGGDPIAYDARMSEISGVVHGLRLAEGVRADLEDTRFTVLLAWLALFGNAIAGPKLRRSAHLGDEARANRRFLEWLANLLRGHLQQPTE